MHKFKIFFSAVNLLILSILMGGGGRSYASSTRHCYTINYPVNVSEVRVGFADNRQTTDSIAAFLRQVENNPALTLTGIDVSGSASPEGNPRINARLASKRMEAACRYLETHYNIGDSLINRVGAFVQ